MTKNVWREASKITEIGPPDALRKLPRGGKKTMLASSHPFSDDYDFGSHLLLGLAVELWFLAYLY